MAEMSEFKFGEDIAEKMRSIALKVLENPSVLKVLISPRVKGFNVISI